MKLCALISFVILAVMTAMPAQAETAAFRVLLNDAKWNVILQNTASHGQCPAFVMLTAKKATEKFSKPGDAIIELHTYIPSIVLNGSFAAGAPEDIYIRPSLAPNAVHMINKSYELNFGVSYTTLKQTEVNDIIASEQSTYNVMIQAMNRVVLRTSFNARTHELKYHFSNGRSDADCTFSK